MSNLRSLVACSAVLACTAAAAAPVNELRVARAQKGMVGFASVLTPADAEAIRAYLVHLALASEEAR